MMSESLSVAGFSPVQNLPAHPAAAIPVMVLMRIQETTANKEHTYFSEQISYHHVTGCYRGGEVWELDGFGMRKWPSGRLEERKESGPDLMVRTAELAAFCPLPGEAAMPHIIYPFSAEKRDAGLIPAV